MKIKELLIESRIDSDDAFDKIKAAGGSNVTTTSSHIVYYKRGEKRQLAHSESSGRRTVDKKELATHLANLKD